MTGIKTMRRALGVVIGTAGLALAGTVTAGPAQAYGGVNLHMVYGNGPCLRPDSNALGSLVHANYCDGNSNGWVVLWNSYHSEFRLEWLGNGGCLIPNHDAKGEPVVVTNGSNGTVCDRPDAWWFIQLLNDNGTWNIANASNGWLSLDYDISSNHRGLQTWDEIDSNTNQQFYGLG
ncbi:hypothetical protein [Streptacidiphilus rugosus]|uniref:hypothetical protein n=1 Tax=Streptacidiphilus rugosus TaxID=405783 RepID=UPI00056BA5FA|nr:hypothetical protein [Streptacidiphilus rugosus]